MRNLTKAFRQKLFADERNYLVWADITLPDYTQIHLTNSAIWSGGFSIDDAVSSDSSFEALGSAVCNSATLIINNQDEAYSDYDFTHAEVALYVGMELPNGNTTYIEKIKKGTYIVDSATYSDGLITLYCLDFMQFFDIPYQTNLIYPASLDAIVRNACSECDITQKTLLFPHRDFIVREKPDGDNTTFRDVICWAAQIAGCFARMDQDGKLEFKWFDREALETTGWDGGVFDLGTGVSYQTGDTLDGGTLNPWNLGDEADAGIFTDPAAGLHQINALSTQNIGIDDIVLTGVQISVETEESSPVASTETFLAGDPGYVIGISGNEFITKDNALEVAAWLAADLVGLRFRQANVTHPSDPSIEVGDVAIVWDRKGRRYPILITRTTFSVGKLQTTVCGAETPSRNSSIQYDQRTKAFVASRKLVKRELTERERALDNLARALEEKSGLYSTKEVVPGGGTIYYLHDQPRREDSQVVWKMTTNAFGVSTDGGQTWNAGLNVDGTMIATILNSIGVNADWINAGSLEIKKNRATVFKADVDTGHLYIDAKNSAGTTTFKVDSNTGEVKILASSFTLTTGEGGTQTFEEAVQGAGIASITKAGLVEKLGDGETNPGIYLQNNQLKIRADAIYTGVLKGRNGNTKWDLDTGELSMTKGSISLGGTTQVPYPEFSVSSSGHMEAVDAIFRNIYASGPSRDYVKIGTGIEGCFHVPPNNIQLKSRINFTCTDFTGTGQGGIVPSISFLSGAYEFWGDFDPESSSGIPRAVKVYFYTRNFTADASSFYINTEDLRINNYQGYSGTVWIGEHYLIFRHGILTSQGTF